MRYFKYAPWAFVLLSPLLLLGLCRLHEAVGRMETGAVHRPQSLVWVNTYSRVYHRAGSKWYGHTAHGQYMSEREAKADGYILAANGQ